MPPVISDRLRVSFIVTCKGRLAHLQQTLPALVAQPDSECVVVDYDCPERTAEWVARHYPGVKRIQVTDAPVFNLARARNLGAAAAQADWLCFIDADILAAPAFLATLLPRLTHGHFYRAEQTATDVCGSVLCARDIFQAVQGYDEVLQGWGGEDDDLYFRLGLAGQRAAFFDPGLIRGIVHDDAQRTVHYAIRDRARSQRLNCLYLHIKYDLMRSLGGERLTVPVRRSIYAEVQRTFDRATNDRGTIEFEVGLPDELDVPLMAGWQLRRRLKYELSSVDATLPQVVALSAPGILAVRSGNERGSRYLADHATARLHLGCGTNVLGGWLNTDVAPSHADVVELDVTQPFPYPDARFATVFSEHMIEHLAYLEGEHMLKECWRVLQPGGVLRIATPDLAFLIGLYAAKKKTALQKRYLEWATKNHVAWAPTVSETFVVNNFVRDWGHRFIYDEKTLRQALEAAGFIDIVRCPINVSADPALCGLENDARMPEEFLELESMVLEARRP